MQRARVALACAAVALGLASRAGAVPLDDPNIGGIGFSGPTTGDLAAVYWNPAALGLIHGPQLMISSTLSLATTTVRRSPAAGMEFPAARSSDFTHPFSWPPGPGAFLGFGSDVGGDRFSLALAAFVPFAERVTYQGADNPLLPTRYHRIATDLRNLALVPALAVRFAGDLRLGFAPGFVFSTGRLSFDEPTCGVGGNPDCAAEDPAGDARYDIASRGGFASTKFAFTLGGGLYYRLRGWELGLAFSSRPFGGSGASPVGIAGDDTRVTLPSRDGGAPITCMNGRADGRGCVYADVTYKVPYTFTAGVTWRPRPGAEVAVIARYLGFPANDVIDIRITRAPAATDGLPEHIVLYRGYDHVLDTRVRFAEWLGQRLRIGAGFRIETGAVAADAVSPAAIDGLKIQPTAMLTFHPWKHLSIGAGYGFTYMFDVTTRSPFDPNAARLCRQAGDDLGDPSCMTKLAGRARPTAAGTYGSHRHDFNLSVTTQF